MNSNISYYFNNFLHNCAQLVAKQVIMSYCLQKWAQPVQNLSLFSFSEQIEAFQLTFLVIENNNFVLEPAFLNLIFSVTT